jgi:hypothetical protein
MSMRSLALVFALALLTRTSDVSAGVFKGLVEDITSGATRGVVKEVAPVLGSTIADVDNRLTAHEARLGSLWITS